MASKKPTVKQVTELLTVHDADTWPAYVVHIAPAIRDIIEQSAQDVNVSPSTIINIYLARAIVSIDNDET